MTDIKMDVSRSSNVTREHKTLRFIFHTPRRWSWQQGGGEDLKKLLCGTSTLSSSFSTVLLDLEQNPELILLLATDYPN